MAVKRQLPRRGHHRLLDLLDAFPQVFDVLDLQPRDHLVSRVIVQGLGLFDRHPFELVQRHLLTGGSGIETFEAEHQRGALMNQQHSPAQQIPHRPQFRVVDVASRQALAMEAV